MLIKCKTGGEMIEVPEGQDPARPPRRHRLRPLPGQPLAPTSTAARRPTPATDPGQPTRTTGRCWDGTGTRPDGCNRLAGPSCSSATHPEPGGLDTWRT